MARTRPPGSDKLAATPSARKDLARQRLIALTRLMDEAVEVPALGTRVGLDALLGIAFRWSGTLPRWRSASTWLAGC